MDDKTKTVRIAFDVGGVLTRYPDIFFSLIETLRAGTRAVRAAGGTGGVEVHVISDMHPVQKIVDMLRSNGYALGYDQVHSADYQAHGEECKARLCEELGIDVLVDDFIGYLASQGSPPVRLLVMPDPTLPYYADEWSTDGSEGNFGRRNPPGSKRPPEDRGREKETDRDQLHDDRNHLAQALHMLLLSADCSWEEQRLGHDWAEACEHARQVLRASMRGQQ